MSEPCYVDLPYDGEELIAALTKAESALQSPLAGYTETGSALTFASEIAIPLDGGIYSLTITGDTSLSAIAPTAPECGSAIVYVTIDTATPPVIAIDAAWHWPDSSVTLLPTTDGAKAELLLNSTPLGWVVARATEVGVPS